MARLAKWNLVLLLTGTSLGIFASKGKQVTAVAAPVGGEIGEALETVRDAVIDLLLVGIGLVVRLADTFGDNLLVAFAVAGILAVRTLHARSVLEELSAQRTTHDVVKLLGNELVALLLVNLFLLLAHGTLTVETNVERPTVFELLGYVGCQHVSWYIYKRFAIYQSSLRDEYGQMAPMQTMNQSSQSGAHSDSRLPAVP